MTTGDDGTRDTGDRDDYEIYDADDAAWTDDDEARYQARRREELRRVRRRRRQAGSFGAIVLVVLLVGLGAAGVYQGWWQWPFGGDDRQTVDADAVACPTPEQTAAAVADVVVNVLNATETRGLAASVSAELQARGMTVAGIGNDDATVADVAQVRYGPESVMAARTVAAQFPGAVLVDDQRTGTAVELSVGTAFTALNPPEVAAAAVAPVPAESPSGCVTPAPSGSTTDTAPPADPAATDPAATPTG